MIIENNDLKQYKVNHNLQKYFYSFITITPNKNKNLLIFSDGCDYLIINSKMSYKILQKQETYSFTSLKRDESYFIIRLKPYTLNILLEQNFFKANMYLLSIELFKTPSIIKQTMMIQHYLLGDYVSNKKINTIAYAIDLIHQHKGIILKQELAYLMNISDRTLQRLFQDTMGLSPKKYINIIRFQSLITKMSILRFFKTHNLPTIFTDYSHMYKDFKKYTGVSPKEFYTTDKEHIGSIFDIY